jgi:hypothetical protein
MRGDTARLLNDAINSNCQRPAAHDGAAAAKGAHALLDYQRVAVSNCDLIHRNAHLLGRNLGEHGLMALAVGAGAGKHRNVSAALHPNRCAFETYAPARLRESREADAD